jgi:hypothetical protein
MGVHARRPDDRIRQLCADAIAAKTSHMARPILAELQLAIHQYTQRLRHRAAAIFTCSSARPPERRKARRDRRQRATSYPKRCLNPPSAITPEVHDLNDR